MEWTRTPAGDDSLTTPADRIDFDMIRALISTRQANSPTLRALHGVATLSHHSGKAAPTAAMNLLNGRAANLESPGGSFCPVDAPRASTSGVSIK